LSLRYNQEKARWTTSSETMADRPLKEKSIDHMKKQKRTLNIIPKFDQWYDFDAITKNLDLDTYRRGNGEVM
jgi:hypothetical protein